MSVYERNKIIEKLLTPYPAELEDRRLKLADVSWRNSHPILLQKMYDVEFYEGVVKGLEEKSNPFSYTSMLRRANALEAKMINTAPSYRYVLRDPETGEVLDEERFVNRVNPYSEEARRYVAELN